MAAEDARVRAAHGKGSAVDTPDATAVDLEMAPAQ
jgi:acyl-CoA oxidase